METIGNLFSIPSTQIPSAPTPKQYQNDENENSKLKKMTSPLMTIVPFSGQGLFFMSV